MEKKMTKTVAFAFDNDKKEKKKTLYLNLFIHSFVITP